jgi:hypothetical protein
LAAEGWIRSAVALDGPVELVRARPWATIAKAASPVGVVWFKACAPVQRFEPRLTADLAERWPDRVARVLAHDPMRGWLLTADAGDPVAAHDNDPRIWLRALPLYAELQRGEVAHTDDHLHHGVPDRRVDRLPGQFAELLASPLPIEAGEVGRLRKFAPDFGDLCAELSAASPVATIQHDDLHLRSLFVDGPALRVLDWGDACIGHPFSTLVVTFTWLEEVNGLPSDDGWFARLRDAYLEPWDRDLRAGFDLAMRVGLVAEAVGWLRHRSAMTADYRRTFDPHFAGLLRRVLARAVERRA